MNVQNNVICFSILYLTKLVELFMFQMVPMNNTFEEGPTTFLPPSCRIRLYVIICISVPISKTRLSVSSHAHGTPERIKRRQKATQYNISHCIR